MMFGLRCVVVTMATFLLATNCFAAGSETFDATWDTMGKPAQQELARLPAEGRAAYRKALIACSLFADEYNDEKYGAECQRAIETFSIDFAGSGSFITILFKTALSLSRAYASTLELTYRQGQRPDLTAGNPAKVDIEVLKKVFRDTRPRPTRQ